MSRRFTDQAEVLHAIRARLQKVIPRYSDQNCFLSDEPIPSLFPGGQECCTVSPGTGSFADALFSGSGVRTLTEDSQVLVTPLIRHKRDRPNQSDQALLSEYDGVIIRKGEILAALLGADNDLEIDGRFLLRNAIAPISAQAPGHTTVGKYDLVGLTIVFSCPFDWGFPDQTLESST